MLPRRVSFQPGVGPSIPSDLLRAMPGHWQLRELAGAYVNGRIGVNFEHSTNKLRPLLPAPAAAGRFRGHGGRRDPDCIYTGRATVTAARDRPERIRHGRL